MLVLSRKIGEKIVIEISKDRKIELCVVAIQAGKVKLGVEAPRDVSVMRSELLSESGK